MAAGPGHEAPVGKQRGLHRHGNGDPQMPAARCIGRHPPVPTGYPAGRWCSARRYNPTVRLDTHGHVMREPAGAERINAVEQLTLARKAINARGDQLRFLGPEV